MLGSPRRRTRVGIITAGVLLLASVGSAGSAAPPSAGSHRQVPAVAASAAHAGGETLATAAARKSALAGVLRRHLGRRLHDDAALRKDLAAIGVTNVRTSGAAETQRPTERTAASGTVRTAADNGDGHCPNATATHRFNCELLLFHETSPGYTYSGDSAVLMWDFVPVGEPKPKGSPLDDIAAIDFGNYNEKCYDPGKTSQAAWTFYPGGKLNGKPAQEVNDLVRPESQSPNDNAAVWRVIDQPGEADLPKPLVGFVEIDLRHRTKGPECPHPDPYQEIRAVGHFLHSEEGDGDWSGVTVGAGYGPLSVSYTPQTDPGTERQSTTPILSLHSPDGGGGGGGGSTGTNLVYTGPTNIRYHVPFTASARLTRSSTRAVASGGRMPGNSLRFAPPGTPIAGARVRFTLGIGGGTQTCTDTTNSSGVASCRLTPTQRSGTTTLTVRYLGGNGVGASASFVSFTIQRQFTEVAYTGPKRVANGVPAHLSGVLREKGGPPIADGKLRLRLGYGAHQQSCTGTTDSFGKARCTIKLVDQPLNSAATVPVAVSFARDAYYLPSSTSATLLLEYYTGRSYGLTARVDLPLLALVNLFPTPDTGGVRTAHASSTATSCTAAASVVLVSSGALCPKVTTSLAPGTATATSTVERTTIGIPGLPVIEVRGAAARSVSTCGSGGSATGSTTIAALYVGGSRVTVSAGPNSVINLPGLARLVVNEQQAVAKSEHGLTVNALHLSALDGDVDVVVASASSGVHNCAS